MATTIKPIDRSSIHRITSGQVVIDLQTAVKELVENSIDAGATSIEVRFKQYGIKSIEVIDNGSGIAEEDYESIALKHHTSKLASFEDLSTVRSFGFRGEALSSLCALSETVIVTTATAAPMGVSLEMDRSGRVKKKSRVARQRGTSLLITNLFLPLAVRRKEFERNAKREFGKALALLNAYALGPCATGSGIRFTVTNQLDKSQKTEQIRTQGVTSWRASVSALWGPKALENIVDLELNFDVEQERAIRKGSGQLDLPPVHVQVRGLISKFNLGCGRTGTDRQFFYINGRPCNLGKVQKAVNEVYRSFNMNQAPFVLADFVIPTDSCDVNVSPDKRTIFLHNEGNLLSGLKAALEVHFAPERATYDLGGTQSMIQSTTKRQTQLNLAVSTTNNTRKANRGSVIARDRRLFETQNTDDASGRHDQPSPNESNDVPRRRSSSPTLSCLRPTPPSTKLTPPPSPPSSGEQLETSQRSLLPNQEHSNKRSPLFEPDSEEDIDPQPLPDQEPEPSGLPVVRNATPEDSGEPVREDTMDLDEPRIATLEIPSTPSPTKTKKSEVHMILNPSQTSWGRKLRASQGFSSSPPASDQIDELDEEAEAPARKKRKSDVGGSFDTFHGNGRAGLASKPALRPTQNTLISSQQHLKSRLAGFARTGSQIIPTETQDNEDEDLPASEEEAEHPACENARRDTPVPMNIDDTPGTVGLTGERRDECLDESSSILSSESQSNSRAPSSSVGIMQRSEVIRSLGGTGDNIWLRFDWKKVENRWARMKADSDHNHVGDRALLAPKISPEAGVSNTKDVDKAAEALARVIDKEDFSVMEVLGQFNLGFIIVRRRKTAPLTSSQRDEFTVEEDKFMDDLFIVDQHAADEKFNFETLQLTTKIQSQKLYRAQPLELTASDELLAMENMEVLQQNGFDIDIDEEALPGKGRLKLSAQPVSKNTTFNMKDLEELIHLMRDRPVGQMVRCSKARAMFAMRACRKSVMVGMPLNRHQMSTVIRHMGTIDQPWNCPHGRPTMRHLLNIVTAGTGSEPRMNRKAIDWAGFI